MLLQPLSPGDIVDVVAPASACSALDLRNGVKALRALGLRPRVSPRIFAKSLLFSNHDKERLAQLKRAIYAPDSKMIWCVRGGYGSLRLIPEIARWKRPRQAKIFLGYSDITTLHGFFNQQWNWSTLHGPLVERFGRNALTERERRELLDVLFGRQQEVVFSHLRPLNAAARRGASVRARLLGGNLAVLQSGLGTPQALDPSGSILFFEDTGERPHRVDRMFSQMAQAGWFRRCRAVVLGEFLLAQAADRRGLWHDVVPRFAKSLSVPLLMGMRAGHGDGKQRTLPLNTRAHLRLGRQGHLTVQTGIDHDEHF